MMTRWRQAVLAAMAILLLSGSAAYAQFDIAGSGYTTFTKSTSGNGTQQTTSNGAGGIVEFHYQKSTFIGGEVSYSFNTADQKFSVVKGSCGYFCGNPTISQTAKLHSVTTDWVAAKQYGNLRPFALAGIGFFVFVPQVTDASPAMNTIVRMGYVYGAGVDWSLNEHWGVRLQYRGNLYKAPNMSLNYLPTGKFTQSAEPAGGIFYRF